MKRRRAGRRRAAVPGAGGPAPAPILGLASAARRVAAARRARPGTRVVLANGLFDLLHVGHLRYLRAARRQGDLLVVALNDDRSARALRGPGRPLVPVRDRSRIVAAVRGVDLVVRFGGRTVGGVLGTLRPDVHCKGTDYRPGTVPEREIVRGYGGRVRVVGDPKRHASTDLLRRMASRPRAAIATTSSRARASRTQRGAAHPRRASSSPRRGGRGAPGAPRAAS